MTATTENPKLVKSPLARISYPWVFKPQEFKDGKKKYNLVMLIPKTEGVTEARKDPKLRAMYAALKAAAIETWQGNAPKNLQLPVKDGDVPREGDDEPQEAYVGMWAIGCTSDRKPGIVGPDVNYLENEAEFYAGCWAFVSLNSYTWTSHKKNGVSFGLRNAQKVKDDEKLGGFTTAHDDFEPIEDSTPAESLEGGDDDGVF